MCVIEVVVERDDGVVVVVAMPSVAALCVAAVAVIAVDAVVVV